MRTPLTIFLVFVKFCALVLAQDDGVASAIGSPMAFSAPFLANSPASDLNGTTGTGVTITDVTRNPEPQPSPGQDLKITASLTGNPSGVTLIYLTNFGPEKTKPMSSGPSGTFTAEIPSSAFKAGDMVRWAITAGQSRSPALTGGDRYFGTVIADSSVNFKIPVMEWFTDDITASTAKTGHNGTAVYYLGRFYDNVFVRRKGVTSLSWPKPKLKFKLSNNEFIYKPDQSKDNNEKKVDTFDLNSLYYEPGQKSYMREAIAYQVLQDVGGVSAINYHIIVRVNSAFYGLFTYTENDDKYYLERNRLSNDGLLVKATSGQGGGLNPFFQQSQLVYYYGQQNQKKKQSAWPFLYQFTQGIAGNGDKPRSTWVFDNVELSETINTMAVLTMLLTQDRCTKNYMVYRDPNTTKWQLLGYDLKSAMNTGAGYMGVSASDYCTLVCSQWNSPLFCDRGHPQDVSTSSANPFNSIEPGSIGRKLLQNVPAPGPGGIPDNGPKGVNVNITNPNVNLVSQGQPNQDPSTTWNYLIDLITQVPETRQMYMRRLRTITDEYLPSGKLVGMITSLYNDIKEAADTDNQKWNIGSIDLGYKQLTEEQIPTRQQQLLEMYGPGGSQPLLPSSQPDSPGLILNRIDITTALSQRYVEIKNPLDYAVDVTNWELSGAVNAKIKPGTVIASGNGLIIAADSGGFRQRNVSPMLGEGLQVIGKLSGSFSPGEILLKDDSGNTIISKDSGSSPVTG